jgi:hypothetical protein
MGPARHQLGHEQAPYPVYGVAYAERGLYTSRILAICVGIIVRSGQITRLNFKVFRVQV